MNARSTLKAAVLVAAGLGMSVLPAAARGPGGGPAGGPTGGPGGCGPGMEMGMCHGGGMIEWLDDDDDGKVTIEEFRAAHDERITAMDANGDGKITLDEFQSPPKPPKVSRMQRIFQRLDTNNDGVLSREELEQRFDVRFARFDVNGDKVITVEEMQQRRGMCGLRGWMPGASPSPAAPDKPASTPAGPTDTRQQ